MTNTRDNFVPEIQIEEAAEKSRQEASAIPISLLG